MYGLMLTVEGLDEHDDEDEEVEVLGLVMDRVPEIEAPRDSKPQKTKCCIFILIEEKKGSTHPPGKNPISGMLKSGSWILEVPWRNGS